MPAIATKAPCFRFLKFDGKRKSVEFKDSEADQNIGIIKGYLAVFGNVDAYDDIIQKGAFAKTIKEKGSWPLLWQHNPDWPIGKITLLREDDFGLWMEAEVYKDVAHGQDAWVLAKRGAIEGLSIGYEPIQKTYNSETHTRLLTEIKLWEGSEVTFPANDLANITDVRGITVEGKVLVKKIEGLGGSPSVMKAQFLRALKGEDAGAYQEVLDEIDQVVESMIQIRGEVEAMMISEGAETDEPGESSITEPGNHSAADEDLHSLSEMLAEAASMAKNHF